jgi:raffinose/stachyose/melibiose transport system permease protein
VINLVVVLGPSVAAVYYAFTDWSGFGHANFIGLGNFRALLHDADFLEALRHNLIWTAISLTVPIAMGLGGAFLLSQITRFQMFFRVAYFLPFVMASVVNGAVWENILSPGDGLGAQLAKLGIPWLKDVAFFGDVRLARPSVAFVGNWAWWGFLVVLFLAAMQSVDKELYEAAKVDGASRWDEFLFVTIPGILPTLMFIFLISVIWSFLVFDYVFIITQGGPAGSTEMAATLMYKNAFTFEEAGYAAAMGLSLALVSALVMVVFLLLRRRGWKI